METEKNFTFLVIFFKKIVFFLIFKKNIKKLTLKAKLNTNVEPNTET